MSGMYEYDLVVIGAGIAGFVSAVTASGIGKRVAIVEKRKVGGNCTNLTCVPSKALVRLGHLSREICHLRESGLLKAQDLSLDKTEIMDHVRSIVQKAYEKDLPETFESIGIKVLMGSASFIDSHHISLDGKTISSDNFIIATGTRPVIPPIAGLADVNYLTNENLYDLDRLPDSLIILGGGVDGLEYASALGRIGVKVTVVEMSDRLLPMADREPVKYLLGILARDGIRILSGARAIRLQTQGDHTVLDYEFRDGARGSVSAERVLVAIGRRPDLDGLLPDRAGVACNERGVITDSRLRTTSSNIYACGDIAGPYQLASMAEYQGMTAATNMFSPIKLKARYDNNINIIFTDPPLAFFGMTEEQAHAKYGHKLKVYRFEYSNMRRALIDGTNVGMAKFLCDNRGRLVGAHILGEAAGEVIHEAQMLRAMKKPLHWGQLVTHAYPTYAQALVGRASQLAFLDKMSSNPFVRLGLWALPGLSNRLGATRERLAETEPQGFGSASARISIMTDSGQETPTSINLQAVTDATAGCAIRMASVLMDQDETPYVTLFDTARLNSHQRVTLDFSEVTRINGMGACMILKLLTLIRKTNRAIGLVNLNTDLRDIFKVTELNEITQKPDNLSQSPDVTRFDADSGNIDSQHSANSHATGAVENRGAWANPIDELNMNWISPGEARKLNVIGRRAVGPVNGFGPLWEKTYRLFIDDSGITPDLVVRAMKENFALFQPSCNKFYPSPSGISPGEIVLIDSMTPGGPVSTGVMVMYADEGSFTFVTPQGHPEAGWVSFSAYSEHGRTVAQIYGLARAGDPLFEAAFRVAGSGMQVRIWTHVLASLAAYLGTPANITYDGRCKDRSMQWGRASNIWYNAQIITLFREPSRWFS